MNHRFKTLKRFFLVVYVVFWNTVFIASGIGLTIYLVGTLGDPLAGKGSKAANAKMLDSVLALTNKKVVRYLGKWEFVEPKLPGHFHHIGKWYQQDKWNFCISCHTATPHSRTPQQRAFLNMHNLFISCQVCHVQQEEGVPPTRFGWVDLTTGKLCKNPTMTEGVWGEYGAKIVPLTGSADNPQIASLDEEEAFAEKFRKQANSLDDRQEAVGKKFIHRRCIETPVHCSDCHNSEKAFLPYRELGYSEERANFLVSAEVADLVSRYETFYIPNLLRTDDQSSEKSGEEPK